MDLQQNTNYEKPDYNIYVLGDPILDIYYFPQLRERRFGGAANVENNINALLRNKPKIRVSALYDNNHLRWASVIRHQDNSISRTPRSPEYRDNLIPLEGPYSAGKRCGLVISDYNKGSVNGPLHSQFIELANRIGKFEFIIVDSRYGTFNPDYLNYGRMKMLHATGDEINRFPESILLQFKYIIQTNGSNDVVLYGSENEAHLTRIKSFPVPDTQNIIDTTGAGDTFTASIASSLAQNPNEAWDVSFIKKAIRTAIGECQQVIQVFGVSTPGARA